jgi:cytosine/adenosine deaminase-related metal-dependent hydrolase
VVSPPIRDGAVAVTDGVVNAVGPARDLRDRFPKATEIELGEAILLPGLVNAHTHLSLTDLSSFPLGSGFLDWLPRLSKAAAAMSEKDVCASVEAGVEESWALGTVLLGEITTRPDGVQEILDHGRMMARVYYEFLGLREDRARERFETAKRLALDLGQGHSAPTVLAGLSPHAPYSVWPDLWGQTVAFSKEHDLRWSTHLGEPPGEQEFLKHGTGPLRDFMESKEVWDDAYPVPGKTAMELLADHGAPDERALLVHGLHLEPNDVARIAGSGASICLCPRSNSYLGLPASPVRELHESGINLCLGTDSMASNHDLSVWAEMRALRELARDLPARRLLEMATIRGARALGMDHLAGSIQDGLPARILAVDAPDLGQGDPHDFLVREDIEGRQRHLEPGPA